MTTASSKRNNSIATASPAAGLNPAGADVAPHEWPAAALPTAALGAATGSPRRARANDTVTSVAADEPPPSGILRR